MTPTSVAPGTSPDAAVSQHHGRDDRAERTLRVCVIGKYPPIQGGISAQCYWMCRWLAERGHEVDVVTNADEVEDHYRLRLDGNGLADGDMRGSLRVWRTESPTLAYRHIPQTNPVVTKLTSLALEAIDRIGLRDVSVRERSAIPFATRATEPRIHGQAIAIEAQAIVILDFVGVCRRRLHGRASMAMASPTVTCAVRCACGERNRQRSRTDTSRKPILS